MISAAGDKDQAASPRSTRLPDGRHELADALGLPAGDRPRLIAPAAGKKRPCPLRREQRPLLHQVRTHGGRRRPLRRHARRAPCPVTSRARAGVDQQPRRSPVVVERPRCRPGRGPRRYRRPIAPRTRVPPGASAPCRGPLAAIAGLANTRGSPSDDRVCVRSLAGRHAASWRSRGRSRSSSLAVGFGGAVRAACGWSGYGSWRSTRPGHPYQGQLRNVGRWLVPVSARVAAEAGGRRSLRSGAVRRAVRRARAESAGTRR